MEQVVKCLVFTHPDDSLELHEQQRARIRELWEATRASGHELLEIIPPTDTLAPGDQGQAVVRSVTQLYDQGIKPEWWKVGVMSEANWSALDDVVRERDPCCRRAVILDLSQPLEQLISGFSAASGPLAKGFMVGRSVWAEPAPHGSVVN
jgi:5-dehydro-2-deoxygluconokinase